MGVDLRQDTLPQLVFLQEMTEIQDGGLVGQGTREFQPCEPPHRVRLIEQILHARVAQVVEELDAVDSQHDVQRVRMSPPSGLEVEGADAVLQQLPGGLERPFAPGTDPAGLALLALVFQVGKGRLVHQSHPRSASSSSAQLCHTPPDLFREFLGLGAGLPARVMMDLSTMSSKPRSSE